MHQVTECGAEGDDPLSPSKLRGKFALMSDAIGLMGRIGAIPAGGLTGLARDPDRPQLVARINMRIRALLEAAEVDPELIDQVADVVIGEAVLELAQMEADAVRA